MAATATCLGGIALPRRGWRRLLRAVYGVSAVQFLILVGLASYMMYVYSPPGSYQTLKAHVLDKAGDKATLLQSILSVHIEPGDELDNLQTMAVQTVGVHCDSWCTQAYCHSNHCGACAMCGVLTDNVTTTTTTTTRQQAQCYSWCTQQYCGTNPTYCGGCSLCGGSLPDPVKSCDSWCTGATDCNYNHCGACAMCGGVLTDNVTTTTTTTTGQQAQCVDWCTQQTCGMNPTFCGGCSLCGGSLPDPVKECKSWCTQATYCYSNQCGACAMCGAPANATGQQALIVSATFASSVAQPATITNAVGQQRRLLMV